MSKFIIYKARDGFRWRLVTKNGRTIADGAESYTRRFDARKAVRRVVGVVIGHRWAVEYQP